MATAIGDRFVRRQNAARTSTSNTTAADIGYDTAVLSEGGYSWTSPEVTVDTTGRYLCIFDLGFVNLAGSDRAVGTLVPYVNGAAVHSNRFRATHRYLRNSGGAQMGASIGMCVLDLTASDTVKVRNPGAITPTDAFGNYATDAGLGGALQLIYLGNPSMTHVQRTVDAAEVGTSNINTTRPWLASSGTWIKVTYDSEIEDTDSLYPGTGGDVTLAANTKYLIAYGATIYSTDASRHTDVLALNIGGTRVQTGSGYQRNTASQGPPIVGMYLHETGGTTETLYLEATHETEGGDAGTPQVADAYLQVITLPSSADWIHVDNGATDSLTTALNGTSTYTDMPLTSTLRSFGGTALSLSSPNGVQASGAVSALGINWGRWDRDTGASGTRKSPFHYFNVNGSRLGYGIGEAYSRGQQSTDDCWQAHIVGAAVFDHPDTAYAKPQVHDPTSGSNADMGIYASTSRYFLGYQELDLSTLNPTVDATIAANAGGATAASSAPAVSAGGASATIAYTALTSGSSNTPSTSFITASVSPTADALQLLAVSSEYSTTVPTQPTVTGCGLTWVAIRSFGWDDVGTTRRLTLFRALGGSPTTGTLTIDFGTETDDTCRWSLIEFTGVDTGGTNGSAAVVQDVQDPASVGSGTSIAASLAAFSDSGNATYGVMNKEVPTDGDVTTDSEVTVVHNVVDASNDSRLMTVVLLGEPTDSSVDWSWGTNRRRVGFAVEIAVGTAPPDVTVLATAGGASAGGGASSVSTTQNTTIAAAAGGAKASVAGQGVYTTESGLNVAVDSPGGASAGAGTAAITSSGSATITAAAGGAKASMAGQGVYTTGAAGSVSAAAGGAKASMAGQGSYTSGGTGTGDVHATAGGVKATAGAATFQALSPDVTIAATGGGACASGSTATPEEYFEIVPPPGQVKATAGAAAVSTFVPSTTIVAASGGGSAGASASDISTTWNVTIAGASGGASGGAGTSAVLAVQNATVAAASGGASAGAGTSTVSATQNATVAVAAGGASAGAGTSAVLAVQNASVSAVAGGASAGAGTSTVLAVQNATIAAVSGGASAGASASTVSAVQNATVTSASGGSSASGAAATISAQRVITVSASSGGGSASGAASAVITGQVANVLATSGGTSAGSGTASISTTRSITVQGASGGAAAGGTAASISTSSVASITATPGGASAGGGASSITSTISTSVVAASGGASASGAAAAFSTEIPASIAAASGGASAGASASIVTTTSPHVTIVAKAGGATATVAPAAVTITLDFGESDGIGHAHATQDLGHARYDQDEGVVIPV